jgi:formylglycine-generating enzyme required for sulfatase activity
MSEVKLQYKRNANFNDNSEKMGEELPEEIQPAKNLELEMVLIPAGEFLMGSVPGLDQSARTNEYPQHFLYLPDYYIAKTPVTKAQYAAFVQATGYRQPTYWGDRQPPPGKQDHPVVYVSWDDAVAYCQWLSKNTGQLYRLPTEAEWEKAARGTDSRIYPWGNQWSDGRCNTPESGLNDTTPVETYPDGASPYGLLDMVGNVWEWCSTKWNRPYPYVAEDEWRKEYLQEDVRRALRSGSFYDYKSFARCASRWFDFHWSRSKEIGFRVMIAAH